MAKSDPRRFIMVLARCLIAAIALGLAGNESKAGELTIGLATEPSSMDPHFHNLTPNNGLLSHVFERLVETDAKDKLIPGLAESWKTINDTTWEFKLRKGVKWHDGSPFTADDVLFTFERAPNVPNSPSGFGAVTRGKAVRKIDAHSVEISTEAPYPLMPNDLSNLLIVSERHGHGARTEDYNTGRAVIGTGPFRLHEYVPGDRIVLVRHDGYWGARPQWDEVTLHPITTAPSRVAALLAGDVDLIEDVPTADISRLRTNPAVDLAQSPTRRLIYLHMDQFRDESPFIKGKDGSAIKNPLKDVRVRRALSMAINRDAIVSHVMEGCAIAAGQFLPSGFFGISTKIQPQPHDPEGAKKLLAEAGYPNGFRMMLHGPNGRYTNDVKIAEAVAQMFTRVGVETAIETLPPAVFFSRASTGASGQPEFSVILAGWSAETGETLGALRPLVATFDPSSGAGAVNRGRHSDPELDGMLKRAAALIDADQRRLLLAEIVERAIANVAIIPLHHPIATWAARKGLAINPRTDERTLAIGVSEN
jgi:peptide/nickel transport system substrate-binding protein